MGGGTPYIAVTSDINNDDSSKVKLLFAQSKVYFQQTKSASDKVCGVLVVIQKFLIPEADNTNAIYVSHVQLKGSLNHGTAINSFWLSIEQIRGLVVTWPTFMKSHGSVIFNMYNGSSMGPLFFHEDEKSVKSKDTSNQWGGVLLLHWLDRLYSIKRSKTNFNFFSLLPKTPNNNTVKYSSDTIRETDCSGSSNKQSLQMDGNRTTSNTLNKSNAGHGSHTLAAQLLSADYQKKSQSTGPFGRPSNSTQWDVFETFSYLTKSVKDLASYALEHPTGKQVTNYLPASLSEFSNNFYNNFNTNSSTHSQGNKSKFSKKSNSTGASIGPHSDSDEYESSRVYLAQWARQHVIRQQEELNLCEIENMNMPKDQNSEFGGSEVVWDDLIGESSDLDGDEFEVIDSAMSAKLSNVLRTKAPLSAETWFSYFCKDGVIDPEEKLQCDKQIVLKAIFSGGIEDDIRPIVWKYLLGVYPWTSTEKERKAIDAANEEKYYTYKAEWLDNVELQESDDFLEQNARILKDVLRTDRNLEVFATDEVGGTDESNLNSTGFPGSSASLEHLKDILLTFHYTDVPENGEENQKLGYVQGMSDLLSPLYVVIQDESSTYVCFVNFMRRMRRNFLRDQSGMGEQLETLTELIKVFNYPLYQHLEKANAENMFCSYRWLLIWFKRELEFSETLNLWEILWTDYLCTDFVILVAFGILLRHGNVIMDHLVRFDEILKYINGLNGELCLNVMIKDAEILFYRLKYRIEILDKQQKERESNMVVEGALVDLSLEDKPAVANVQVTEHKNNKSIVVSDRIRKLFYA
ncbi:hypothetical protein BB561_005626 [Smittium simulii]|uniref:Rab-GAP TBC domain-containing protein n=1 Tax=Smittium simulii TaxID=133385 RepID=A0A2T9Y9J0_9FUNG|nr:hypothetical protein BB561_005626 [Smittium simulii]